MKVNGVPYRSIWFSESRSEVDIIDQTLLPHRFEIRSLQGPEDAAEAIRNMRVRGAPLIGATAAWGVALALVESPDDGTMSAAIRTLSATRPTAINLRWALWRMQQALSPLGEPVRAQAAIELAQQICDEDVEINFRIGRNGLALIQRLLEERGDAQQPFRILTHCNAGWLATVDWGTALAPIYQAHDAGIPVHVWVDETRPRNQGAALTAWELSAHGVPHDLVVDNAGGHLMQQGLVDLCITGTDRTARNGDVCNKIGTYLKALAARDNGVPFHVALPGPTIDWALAEGVGGTPIEERDPREITEVTGLLASGEMGSVRITPPGTTARNFAFDVTPARLVSGLITERGCCPASESGLRSLYPDHDGAGDD